MATADRLERYREKRDFARTPEPAPREAAADKTGRAYAIQKHAARRLHYDLRLEHDGALLSFAVTKGPSLDPADKRLAVRTEDHPLDYRTFEGTIPKGEYGGGTVMLWDEGTWEPHGDVDEGLSRGKLSFGIAGKRLSGDFALVRMKGKSGENRENWLLVKERDGREDPQADPVSRFTTSIATGRTMEAIAREEASRDGAACEQKKAARTPARRGPAKPAFVKPALATLKAGAPAGEDWIHEIKLDGYRVILVKDGDKVRVFTRSGKDWTNRFPDIVRAAAGLDAGTAVLDGEAVARDGRGRTDFSSLQKAMAEGGAVEATFFDCLHRDGTDLRDKPLLKRKAHLREILPRDDPVLRYSDHVEGAGPRVFEEACRLGAEGIVSKRAEGRYRSGRTRGWLKVKCINEEEMVVGGYTPSTVRGKPFASLLVGTHEGGRLVYRGRVGSGFSADTSERLAALMEARARKTAPFEDLPREAARGARFVRPDLVAVVRYTETTADGILRHPSFRGLREDKPARAVSRSAERGATADTDAERPPMPTLTSPDKVLYPATDLTKRDLADYFAQVADVMLPHVVGRPLSLVRCPDGEGEACFFQKHHARGLPDALKPLPIREKGGGKEPYLVIEDAAGLAACAQIGALELHVWGAPAAAVDHPDRMVFDLDPAEGLAFDDVRDAAREVRDLLSAVDLPSFPLLTGGKGIHVIVPLDGTADWGVVKPFSAALARALAAADPDRYLARASKAARRGRIFVDWLRNARGATAIAPFSPRARAAATVATPVRWDELSRLKGADAYTIKTLPRRLSQLKADPWEGFEAARATLSPDLADAVARAAKAGRQ